MRWAAITIDWLQHSNRETVFGMLPPFLRCRECLGASAGGLGPRCFCGVSPDLDRSGTRYMLTPISTAVDNQSHTRAQGRKITNGAATACYVYSHAIIRLRLQSHRRVASPCLTMHHAGRLLMKRSGTGQGHSITPCKTLKFPPTLPLLDALIRAHAPPVPGTCPQRAHASVPTHAVGTSLHAGR